MRLFVAALLLPVLAPAAGQECTYWIEPCDRKVAPCRDGDAELAEWSLQAWSRASGGGLHFRRVGEAGQAQLRFLWARAMDGLYGEARPIWVNGRLGAELHIRPDLSQLGPEIAAAGSKDPLFRDAVVYLTCLHESGHALGLPHTAGFGDIMYSFQFGGDILEYFMRYRRKLAGRDDIRRHPGLSSADEGRLRARQAALLQ